MTTLHNPPSPNTGPKSGTILSTPPSTGLPLPMLLHPYPQLNKEEYPNTPPVTLDVAPNSSNGNTRRTTPVPCATTQKIHNMSYSVHTLIPKNMASCSHQIRNALHFIHTNPQLIQSFIDTLHTWHDNTAPTTQPPNHSVTHQQAIGWYPCLHGHISPSWHETQTLYLLANHSNKSP